MSDLKVGIKVYLLYGSGFLGHTVSVASTHLCQTKATDDAK